MIRHLRKDELPRMHDIGREFFVAAKRPGTWCPAAFDRLWGSLLDAGVGIFLVAEKDAEIVGLFGGIICEDAFNGEPTATEFFWYATPSARGSVGIRLLDAFEREAAERGATRIMMTHLNHLGSETLQKLYERRGYRSIEQTYEKILRTETK
jgi:GNAT superfamily N-acetyltransferase